MDCCDRCEGYAKQGPIDLDANFDETSYGPVKSAPGHPFCVCSVKYLLKDLSEDVPDTEEKSVKGSDDEARDENGQWTSGGLGGTGGGKKRAKEKDQAKPTKAEIAKQSASRVDKRMQRFSEESNEPQFAKGVGGASFKDNQPVDVAFGGEITPAMNHNDELLATKKPAHGVELKTVSTNKSAKLTMDRYAQVRKVVWERETGAQFHTVAIDDTAVFAKAAGLTGKETAEEATEKCNAAAGRFLSGDKSGFDFSKRRYFYRRGIAGSARLDNMEPCKSMADVKRLMAAPEASLPKGAQRTDGIRRSGKEGVTVGKWKAFSDDKGKGFKNLKTGEVVRPKT